MKKLLVIIPLLLALWGCESTEGGYEVRENTVIGKGVGFEGFAFEIPEGYQVYDSATDVRTMQIDLADKMSDKIYGAGHSPYKIIMFNGYEVLVLTPSSFSTRPGARRISEMHSRAVANHLSTLGREQQIELLEAIGHSGSVHGELLHNVKIYVDAPDREIPLGVTTLDADAGDGFTMPLASVKRLGNLNEIYCVLAVGSVFSEEEGLYAAMKLLRSMDLEPVPLAESSSM
ncbi:hypothetical protein [Cerasicoccus maritimus]|uniref:hypothetical protein n=1 Tax=Cerasicoccus maritimus TaxID=490089 RepID=UPI00285299DC|nr:hypothetical protein [Cerasicoccus maritimus]